MRKLRAAKQRKLNREAIGVIKRQNNTEVSIDAGSKKKGVIMEMAEEEQASGSDGERTAA